MSGRTKKYRIAANSTHLAVVKADFNPLSLDMP
jgi:hypothetical protein